MQTQPCRGCGKPIVWAKDQYGMRIPLDPKPAVYEVQESVLGITAMRTTIAMVSHFATCPKANEFSRSKK